MNGTTGDFEASDQTLVLAAGARLDTQAGEFRSSLLGNAGFARVDVQLTPRHVLNARLSTSRYYGANNVFFDPASPITNSAASSNGQEKVATESFNLALTSAFAPRVTSHARIQFARALQESSANSATELQQISGVLQGLGRSSILPRQTNAHLLSLAETLSLANGRHSWKFGGDVDWVWTRNFFPRLFGGEYFFQTIKVNPLTFEPEVGGRPLTPLRAYAHQVPRIYEQDFGTAVSHPDSRQYAAFIQDAIRLTDHFALNVGVRYDLQTFRSDGLFSNPLWPDSGKVPFDTNNVAPRAGFAYSLGEQHPLVFRGGYGIFYTRIPQIYTSAVELQNGINQQHLRLNNTIFADRLIFPQYPDALVSCLPSATSCAAPASATGKLISDVCAFAHNFQTPYVQQANASVERELPGDIAVEANYLYVHGSHLIRARDLNLPTPVVLEYPIFDDSGTNFLGTFYPVDSFSTWQFTQALTCPFPPCINPLERPEARLGAITVFESAASSVYNGFTFGLRRRMRRGLYVRVGYTLEPAIDDNQDAVVAGRPATVQNSFATQAERGNSVTDQRNRFVASWMWEPRPFHREPPALAKICDAWQLAGIATMGSGRPINARVLGDANQDGNSDNDRLPAARRNSFNGPDYATTDLRLSRFFHIGDRWKL